MSKIKIESNSSGTGVITLVSPNTDTDRTITLPDESITLGGGVDGIVSTADATAITINSSENVGIGETSPTTKLDILGSANQTQIRMSDASADGNKDTFITSRHNTSTEEDVALIHSRCGGTNSLWLGGTDAFNTQNACTDIKFLTSANNTTLNGTERLHITSDGRGLSQFTAKAWARLDGSQMVFGTGTDGIYDSHNIASVVDYGTGHHGVNLANAMGNTNYAVMGNGCTTTQAGLRTVNVYSYATSLFKFGTTYVDGTVADIPHINLVVFGD